MRRGIHHPACRFTSFPVFRLSPGVRILSRLDRAPPGFHSQKSGRNCRSPCAPPGETSRPTRSVRDDRKGRGARSAKTDNIQSVPAGRIAAEMPAALGRRRITGRSQAKSACRRPSMTRLAISPKPVRASTAVLGSGTLASALKSVLGQAKQPPLLQPKPTSKL